MIYLIIFVNFVHLDFNIQYKSAFVKIKSFLYSSLVGIKLKIVLKALCLSEEKRKILSETFRFLSKKREDWKRVERNVNLLLVMHGMEMD